METLIKNQRVYCARHGHHYGFGVTVDQAIEEWARAKHGDGSTQVEDHFAVFGEDTSKNSNAELAESMLEVINNYRARMKSIEAFHKDGQVLALPVGARSWWVDEFGSVLWSVENLKDGDGARHLVYSEARGTWSMP